MVGRGLVLSGCEAHTCQCTSFAGVSLFAPFLSTPLVVTDHALGSGIKKKIYANTRTFFASTRAKSNSGANQGRKTYCWCKGGVSAARQLPPRDPVCVCVCVRERARAREREERACVTSCCCYKMPALRSSSFFLTSQAASCSRTCGLGVELRRAALCSRARGLGLCFGVCCAGCFMQSHLRFRV